MGICIEKNRGLFFRGRGGWSMYAYNDFNAYAPNTEIL